MLEAVKMTGTFIHRGAFRTICMFPPSLRLRTELAIATGEFDLELLNVRNYVLPERRRVALEIVEAVNGCREDRPSILIEVTPASETEIFRLLENLGYRMVLPSEVDMPCFARQNRVFLPVENIGRKTK